ncbi:lebercilin [Platysternon megacephalum]|uniref:Lebercilin n=1 Tax=Platysternon megacephalum TaxID=55544 RepID=A0A4D9F532_9SAUR|nr:lebercilin [Platysternon megacephalum]
MHGDSSECRVSLAAEPEAWDQRDASLSPTPLHVPSRSLLCNLAAVAVCPQGTGLPSSRRTAAAVRWRRAVVTNDKAAAGDRDLPLLPLQIWGMKQHRGWQQSVSTIPGRETQQP